jgi:predicted acetyltransferase
VPTGYVVYRLNLSFENGSAGGQVDVEELVACDSGAEATLFRYVANIDLFPKVSFWNAHTDAIVPWILRDRRAAVRKRRIDTLWLRLCDVPRALGARSYAHDGHCILEVDSKVFRLEVKEGTGRCSEVHEQPQLQLSASTLATIYLGSVAPSQLARAGLIHGNEADLRRADAMFLWPIAPWCPEIF